jgi:peptide-methionine (S)-S-oxide reductase
MKGSVMNGPVAARDGNRAARAVCLAKRSLGGALLVALLASAWLTTGGAADRPMPVPPAAFDPAPAATVPVHTAVFAGGCFWGVQAVFQHTQGVLGAVSGYAGGPASAAHYEAVGSGTTGHAESVQVTYDPRRISYGQLLQIFFAVAHDPTQVDRQGPDFGPQYRSAIFAVDPAQQQVARRYIAQLDAAKVFQSRIATEVTALAAFYPAEASHQDYATLHPDSPYIAAFDAPKIAQLKAGFPALWRELPVLVGRAQM